MAPNGAGSHGVGVMLSLATDSKPERKARLGNQVGDGGVFMILHTDNFDADYKRVRADLKRFSCDTLVPLFALGCMSSVNPSRQSFRSEMPIDRITYTGERFFTKAPNGAGRHCVGIMLSLATDSKLEFCCVHIVEGLGIEALYLSVLTMRHAGECAM